MKYLIIYHKEDNDGVFSAAIASLYIEKNDNDALIDYVGADYAMLSGDALFDESEQYDYVVMLDISFNDTKRMKALYDKYGDHFIWIDHHAPVIKASFGKNGFSEANGERDTTRSALLLTWKFFFDPIDESYNAGTVPYILRILSAWDSFTFDKENIDKDFAYDVNTGVTNYYKLNVSSVKTFIRGIIDDGENADDVTYLMEIGHTINKYNARRYKDIINNWGDFGWTLSNGRQAVALFLQEQTSSLMFKSLLNQKTVNGIVFKKKPSNEWTVSLYNINDDDNFHCGEYLKAMYGGGGHAGAAGCTLSNEQFIKVMTSKSL